MTYRIENKIIQYKKKCLIQTKIACIFLIATQKYMLSVLIKMPRQGASNEYPQHMFSWRNKKNIYLISPLICSYGSLRSGHIQTLKVHLFHIAADTLLWAHLFLYSLLIYLLI